MATKRKRKHSNVEKLAHEGVDTAVEAATVLPLIGAGTALAHA